MPHTDMLSAHSHQIPDDTSIVNEVAKSKTSSSDITGSPSQETVFTSTLPNHGSPVPVSARAAARRPLGVRSSNSLGTSSRMTDPGIEDDTRAENARLVQDLKQQVHRAEMASEQYQKQLEVLQLRLDEVLKEQTSFEDKIHQKDAEVDTLHTEIKNFARLRREMEQAHSAEKTIMLRDRERHLQKEEELQTIIHRLNESIRQKEARSPVEAVSRDSETPDLEDEQSAPLIRQETSSDRDDSNLISQKDRMIETLRLELAEAQIKIAETEHTSDSYVHDLEKKLMETKMTNARLVEDNESFQYLLGEKTLKGDFMNDTQSIEQHSGLGTLAEELESAGDGDENENEAYKKLEVEARSLREGNKALSLYIDKIIGRLLQHEGFEHIILDRDEPPKVPGKSVASEKPLPAAPASASNGLSLLERAKSVVGGRSPSKPKPATLADPESTLHENPQTAPSIPINRTHRRSRSDQVQPPLDVAAAAVVGQMYRTGTPLRVPSGGPMSPGISPAMSPSLTATRTPFFQPVAAPATSGRATSSTAPSSDARHSSSNSSTSSRSGDVNSIDTSSPPRTVQSAAGAAIPGAVMKQNQLRPLRLVRQQSAFEEDEENRRGNRNSWMGWFKGSSVEANYSG